MRPTFLIMLIMCALEVAGQITSLPHTQDFEQVFRTGTDVAFIANWHGNEVNAGNRIFQGSDGRANSRSLNVIPTSTFTSEIEVSLNMSNVAGGKLSFYAYSKQNGSSSTRPALVFLSSSIDGGNTFIGRTQIGDETTFPNSNNTSFTQYQYTLPNEVGGQSDVIVKMEVSRGDGAGSAAEIVFDDFLIEEAFPPLAITRLAFVNTNTIELTFNQDLETSSAEHITNYSFDFGFGQPATARQDPQSPNVVTLGFSKAFVNNTYTVEVNNVENLDGSSVADQLTFSAKHNTQTLKRQLVINEIYADPTGDHVPNPTVLPSATSAEFIELYNTTEEAIELTGFSLSGGVINDFTLAAKGYVILTSSSNTDSYSSFGQTVAVDSWNTLTNTGEQLILYDQLGNLVDSLTYAVDWYQNDEKANGGWSLEQINPNQLCSGESNWSASISANGGTPGQTNSILNESPDQTAPSIDTVMINSPRELTLVFSELMDEALLNAGNYELINGPNVLNANKRNSLKAVDLTLASAMTSGTTYRIVANGLADCAGNALNPNNATFFFDNEPPSLERIEFRTTQEIHLVFDEPVEAAGASEENNFVLNNGIGSPARSSLFDSDPQRIALEFDQALVLNSNYEISLSGIQDSLGNLLANYSRSFLFSNDVDTVIVINDQLIDVYFHQAIDGNTMSISDFEIEGLGQASSAVLDNSNNRLVHLTFQTAFPENRRQILSFGDINNTQGEFLQLLNTDFIYDTDDPDLLTFEILDAQRLQLNFDEVLDRTSAEIVNHYSASNELGSPFNVERVNGGASVVLNFENSFQQETTNTLTYTNIQDLSGNPINTNRRFDFTYDTRPPRFDTLVVFSPSQLLVAFSEELARGVAENTNNYVVNNNIGQPNAAQRLDSARNIVLLTFNTLGNNSDNELSISNLTDTLDNALSEIIRHSFGNITPNFGNFLITSDSSLRIQFTKNLTQSSAEDVEHYGFDKGVGSFDIIQDSNDASVVDILLTTRLKESTDYRLVVDSLQDEFGNYIPPSSYDFRFNNYLTNIETISPTNLRLTFEQPLLENAAALADNYSIAGAIGNPISAVINPNDSRIVTLSFNNQLEESVNYILTLRNLETTRGAPIPLSRNEFVYDLSPPEITGISSIFDDEIEVSFDEKLDPTSALALNHYSLNNGVGRPSAVKFSSTAQNAVILSFGQALSDATDYILTVDRVEDTQGKAMTATDRSFTFRSPIIPGFRQIVINEVYFDVDARSALPAYEFVELLNLNAEPFNLRGFMLTDKRDTAYFQNLTIAAGEYAVISNTNGARAFGGTVLPNFPSLSNNGETILLIDRRGAIVDSLAFDRQLYQDESKSDGGYTIELINPTSPCFAPANFIASSDPSGGTPGRQNATFNDSPDLSAPEILTASPLSTKELSIHFNEAMDITSLTPENFNLASGISTQSLSINDPFGRSIRLKLNQAFTRGITQSLEVSSVRDCAGNVLNVAIPLAIGAQASFNDLLVTEIMATPTPEVGLPDVEYIEIYNNTNQLIALNEVFLADNSGRTPIGDLNIAASEYLILCKNNAVAELQAFGNVQGVNSFPNLTVKDRVRLEYVDSTEIFSVTYDRSFYKTQDKQNGGYSMEMINLNPACQSPDNWRASDDPSGGTPGRQNAVFSTANDITAPRVTSFEVLSDTSFAINFNEAMNMASFQEANLIFQPALNIQNIMAKDDFGYQMSITLNAPFTAGILYSLSFQGITDCAGNVLLDSFEFAEGRTPQPYELIISEVMADPTPSQGLPESEYVEIHNRSSDILSLDGVILADLVGSTVLPDTVIYPNSYLLLVPNSTKQQFGANTLGLFNWPNLNAEEETLRLFNHSNEELFRMSYTDEWYRSSAKAKGGFSLEMIDLNFPCVQANNWSASESNQGGTPGTLNSINGNNPDNRGPQLLKAVQLDLGTIELSFSERLNPGSLDIVDFNINNNQFIAFQLDDSERLVTLFTETDLATNLVYSITTENLTDCTGNLIDPNRRSITLIVPDEATEKDIVVNEVLFNPRSGGARFVEFYNRSNKYINLKGWRIGGLNDNRFISESDLFIAPNQYFAITNDLVNIQSEYPATESEAFIEINAMPSMRDDKGATIIQNENGLVIDRFDYNEAFHSPLLSNNEGVSLERLSFEGESNDENNWFSASSSNNYATPGFTNSQRINGEARNDVLTISPSSFSPEVTGKADFITLNFNFDQPGNILNITIFDANGNLIRRLSANKLIGTNAFFTWDGTKDDGSRARIGYYMVLTEIISAEGRVSYIKDKVAVGGRF